MGQRPESHIIYGFVYNDDLDEDTRNAWEALVISEASSPEDWKARRAAIAAEPQVIDLADGDDVYAIGYVHVHGDWDAAEDIPPLNVPEGADASMAKICAHLGIEQQPCKWLLFTSYG